ncbi:RICIN domain-containing protein [Candidatus Reidiella endopervernicosa]|uniref:RICIN domain-containing protein n=1 Tax=Candidatus Reidiella endopervernicosa TaxID=2738883 RepID=A0A6N0HWY3_9GAMM|nr:RICIN domain-containing protein [Candidatus Reidiella endopervernicosa]QKQ26890.1 RICIN domain-containing protein [Candidatus Reidiella endopervernicosa]
MGVNNALDMTQPTGPETALKFKATDNGYYRITNLGLGDKHSLENDSQKLIIGPTRKYSGQLWKLKQMGNGNYRLTNMYKSRHSAQTRYYKVLDTDKTPSCPSG